MKFKKQKKTVSPWEIDETEKHKNTLKTVSGIILALALIVGAAFSGYRLLSNHAITPADDPVANGIIAIPDELNPDQEVSQTDEFDPVLGGAQPEEPEHYNYGVKDPSQDPVFAGNTTIGSGANLDDDGPGQFQSAMPIGSNYPRISADKLLEEGTTPTLELLQELRVSCVYDADGEKIDLFDINENGSYTLITDVTLPDGDIYVDAICSGRYIAISSPDSKFDSLYVVFNSGVTSQVTPRGGSWLNVHDTLVTDEATGITTNVSDGPINSGKVIVS